ncbi:phage tail tube protein, partial [Roseomonas elaeocarpi]
MTGTTSYQAGQEATFARLAYVQEAAWGVTPAAKLQQIRFTGESLRGQKTRSRPSEINSTRAVSTAVTTEESAGGDISFGLSYGTFDDLLSGLLSGEWSAASGAASLTNGSVFKSFTLEKSFSPALFMQYPGSQITGGSISVQRGQFLSGSVTVMSKQELQATTSLSTGGTYTAPTTGRVFDPIGGIKEVFVDGAAVAAVCNSVSLNITNDGAGADYGLGSAAAQGMRMGVFGCSGS